MFENLLDIYMCIHSALQTCFTELQNIQSNLCDYLKKKPGINFNPTLFCKFFYIYFLVLTFIYAQFFAFYFISCFRSKSLIEKDKTFLILTAADHKGELLR